MNHSLTCTIIQTRKLCSRAWGGWWHQWPSCITISDMTLVNHFLKVLVLWWSWHLTYSIKLPITSFWCQFKSSYLLSIKVLVRWAIWPLCLICKCSSTCTWCKPVYNVQMECGSGTCVLGVYLVKTLNKVICNRTADDNESTFLKPENESCHTKYWSHII